MTVSRLPRIGIVGPLLGGHPGWVASPGQALARLLDDDGWTTRTTSTRRRPMRRLLDTRRTVRGWRDEVDVVVSLVFSGAGFLFTDLTSRIAQRRLKVPVVLWLHGGNLPAFARRHRRWTTAVFDRAACLVAPSAYLARAFETATGTGAPTAFVIPNPLPLGDYPFRRRLRVGPRLLWMRTFHSIYQPTMAIEVLARLHRRMPTARLTMAGQDRGALASTRALARTRGVEQAIDFVGFLDQATKEAVFARHDIFLNTNRVDNAPVSVVEAAAFGLPVVSTDVGGLPDLVPDGDAALLVGPDDVAGMADAVTRLIEEPPLADRLSQAGRTRAAICDGPVVRQQWQGLLRRIGADGCP